MIYTGDAFPLWRGHFFIGGLSGQQLQRVAFDQPAPQFERRESLLVSLDARVRDVRQGPDGELYVLTDEAKGSLLRIVPR
jgi:glucose/arabinose dehydrogenase